MAHEAKLRRQAVRLGIVLPDPDAVYPREDDRWSSDGFDTLFEGPCKLDYVQSTAGWRVSLRRSGKKGGYRVLTTTGGLEEAMALAKFLGTRNGRRAYRGLAPKERGVETASRPAPKDALAALLRQVNSGAVRVDV